MGKNQNGELLEHGLELDPELSFQITFRKIGAGLENLGNTCFLNSVLQCLTYTEPFAAYLQSGKHKTSCRIAGFCAMCAIQNHVRCALQSTGRILAPKDLVKNIRCISRNFRNARQEDAHEYMVSLLESIHKCCLPTGLPSESPSAYEKSLVHKIFGGHLRSQVKCSECSYGSKKYDPFLDLSLEIAKADSLLKALEHFTAVEELDGGEKQYQCQQCKKKVKAVRQLTIHKAPYVLTMHLKRFGSTITGQKIDKNVHFGPTLDLKPFVSGTYEGDLNYTLYGVLVHAGWSSHSGHYYCFVRTSSGMWYALDDNEVFHVKERTVLEQKAYMLFYVRDRKNPTPRKPADLAPKRSADVVQTQNSVENHVENKEYSVTLLGCRETIQNDMLTTTSSTPAFSPIFTKVAPVTSASIQDSLLKNSCFFKPKGALMEGSVERVINLVQQSTHIHIRAENLSQTDPSAIDDSGNIPHSCTESIDGKSEPLEHEEAKPTNQIMNECLPQNASSVVINGGFISHPNGPKPGVITEHEKSMQGTVATLAGCVVSEELASNPSTKDMECETHTVTVYEMVPSKTLCEILPLTVFEGCVDVAGVKAINDQGEAKATSNHFTAEVQLQISYSAFQESHVDSHPTDSQSKAINDPKKSIVTLPDCNVLQEVGSKAFATVGDHENAFINEKMSSNALSESLPEISLVVKGGETSTGTETKVVNELEESKSADHCIEPEGVTQIVSPVVKDGDCISQDTGATIKAITEHEKIMKSIAVALDTLCECNVLQVASMTSTTGMEQKNVSVNELAPGKALCKVGELMPEVVSSMQLLSETCTEEIVCKVSSLGPGKVPSQLAIEEELCKGVHDVKPEEINSIVFSSKSDTEETISKGANEIEPGEVNLFQLSNQLSTEEVPCLHVNVLEPGEVGTQFSSPSGLERTPCKRVHGLGPEGTDSTQLSNQVGSGGGQNSGNLNEGESSDLYTAEVNGPKPEEYESLYTLTQSSMTYRFDQQEALDNLHCQKVLKPNKHLIKFQASSTNLSSSRLLRACLRIHRKKKHKRSTKHSLEYDKSTQKDFGEESVSVLEPSTSEETQRVPFDSSFSQRCHQGNSGVNKRRRKRRLEHDKSTRKVFGEDSISGLEPSTSEDTQRIPFDSSCSQRCQGNSSVNKRRRKHRFEHGKSTQKVIGEESISSLEPSTSEETRTAAFDSSHTQRILVNSSAIKRHTRELAKDQVDSYAESAAKRLQIDLREKIGHAGTILANKEAPVKRSSSTLTAYSCESSESHGLQTRRSSVNDFMSMLTRGLEETTVARWSNIGGSHSSEIIGSRNGPSISIGYVPDEWDVEYGQGKRKKVKSKKSGLGSLNPFPEFAMTKNRLKKAKLDQSSSGNLPFRI